MDTQTNLDVVHGEVGPDAELKSNAATTIVGDDGHDTWRWLGLLRHVQRHLRCENAVTVDVVLERVDVGELRQIDRSHHRLAINRQLTVIKALRCQLQLSVLGLKP